MFRRIATSVLVLAVAACRSAPAPEPPPTRSETELEMRVVRLKHARAAEIVTYAEDILVDRRCRPSTVAPKRLPEDADAPFTDFQVRAHPATNSVLLSGTSQQVEEAVELLARLDVPATPIQVSR